VNEGYRDPFVISCSDCINIVFKNIINLFTCLFNRFLGFCSGVDEITDLPGCGTLPNPRRSNTSCSFKYEPLIALQHLQAFLNCAVDCK
jgi:hypothetical protein